jgi:peptidoglycan/xylan/chitin deacetylase (PgdA/CDA1 family)
MFYLVRIPKIIQKIYSNYSWRVNTSKKEIYLTFDDGPTPEVTPFVLDLLKEYNVKATFFCIGKNVKKYPNLFKRIVEEGHAVGNHTNNHLDGWNTSVNEYVDDVANAQNIIESSQYFNKKLFRPAYGRITKKQSTILIKKGFKIIMWTLLSGDFDVKLTKVKCYENSVKNVKNGDIIVFHDSEKSYSKLQYVLPRAIKYYIKNKFRLKIINN